MREHSNIESYVVNRVLINTSKDRGRWTEAYFESPVWSSYLDKY